MAFDEIRGFSVRGTLTNFVTLISFAAIALAMLITVGDILIRLSATFLSIISGTRPQWGVYGLVDLTQLAIMWAAPLAIAAAFFRNTHINIDLLTANMSPNWMRASTAFSALASLGLFGICIWTATKEMLGQLEFTTTSSTLNIAYTWYWMPMIVGFAFCLLASALNLFATLRRREVKDD